MGATRPGPTRRSGTWARAVVLGVAAVVLGATTAVVTAPARPPAAAAAARPPVSAIGDSTLRGMTPAAQAVLATAYDVFFDAKSCRRLIIPSCGRTVQWPNTLDTMRANAGQLGDALVVMAGYDDWYDFDVAVDEIVAEARRQGIGRVIWLTYRTQGPYVGVGGAYAATYRAFNAILAAKAAEHPELLVADWDGYTRDRPDWFAADGIHLSPSGAMALAGFLQAHLDGLGLQRCYGPATGEPGPGPTPVPVTQAPPGRFTALQQRVLDTRADPADDVDGPLGAGRVVRLPLAAQGRVPPGTTAVLVNLTAATACKGGFVTALPCGDAVPLASNLNVEAGRTRAALAIVMLSPEGELCVYAGQGTDVVVDLFGAFGPAGLAVNPIAPDRFLDTRAGAAARVPYVGRIGPGTFALAVGGLGPVPAGASAAILNVTATESEGAGYVTVHPCGAPPWVSNLNVEAGQVVANLAVSALDGDGRVCFTTNVATHLVVDAVGWLGGDGLRLQAQTPERVLDTRTGLGGVNGPLAADGVAATPVSGAGLVATVTAVDTGDLGYVTAYPCPDRPTASNLNYRADDIAPNLVVLPPGPTAAACLFTLAPADLVVDRAGALVP